MASQHMPICSLWRAFSCRFELLSRWKPAFCERDIRFAFRINHGDSMSVIWHVFPYPSETPEYHLVWCGLPYPTETPEHHLLWCGLPYPSETPEHHLVWCGLPYRTETPEHHLAWCGLPYPTETPEYHLVWCGILYPTETPGHHLVWCGLPCFLGMHTYHYARFEYMQYVTRGACFCFARLVPEHFIPFNIHVTEHVARLWGSSLNAQLWITRPPSYAQCQKLCFRVGCNTSESRWILMHTYNSTSSCVSLEIPSCRHCTLSPRSLDSLERHIRNRHSQIISQSEYMWRYSRRTLI